MSARDPRSSVVPPRPAGRQVGWPLALGGAALLTVLVVRSAWMCDDAYITLRTVDNLIEGFGLRWNVIERVQAFTHPAWLLLVAPFYAITREAYFTVLAIQIALVVVTLLLAGRLLARSPSDAALMVAAFAGSKAFVDFSTSGLENSLTHALIVALLIVWRRDRERQGRLFAMGAIASGLVLCRLDLAVLVAPLAIAALRPVSRARLTSFALGLALLGAWELFSLIYYGQLVPNTALAKLPAGVSFFQLAGQGARYFLATFHFDPITPTLLAVAIAMLVWRGGRPGRLVATAAGLYCVYVMTVGGDFMAGRFLTPAYVLAVAGAVSLVRWPGSPPVPVIAAGAILALSVVPEASPLRARADFGSGPVAAGQFDRFGVTDERRFYYPSLGLLPVLEGGTTPASHAWAAAGLAMRASGEAVREASNTGLVGFYAGPGVYIIDRNALSDPFLARLPPRPGWRVGHYTRDVPAGYVESRRLDENRMPEGALRRLYDRVQLLTRGSLWQRERWRAIGEQLSGRYNPYEP